MDYIEIHRYHDGELKKGKNWEYVGGIKDVWKRVYPDKLDFFSMFNFAKECGEYNEIKQVYFQVPDKSLTKGLKELKLTKE